MTDAARFWQLGDAVYINPAAIAYVLLATRPGDTDDLVMIMTDGDGPYDFAFALGSSQSNDLRRYLGVPEPAASPPTEQAIHG